MGVYRFNDVIIRGNYVHHNFTKAVHPDMSCNHITYECNIIEYNDDDGLKHEVNDTAVIRCNISRYNGYCSRFYAPELNSSCSRGAEFKYNVVVVDAGWGIFIDDYGSGGQRRREWGAQNTYVHHNDITYLNACPGCITGFYALPESLAVNDEWVASRNIRFDYNSYHGPDLNHQHWLWKGLLYSEPWGFRTWDEWRGYGHDEHGTFDTDVRDDRQLNEVECADCNQSINYWRNQTSVSYKEPAGNIAANMPGSLTISYDPFSRIVVVNIVPVQSNQVLTISLHNALGRTVGFLQTNAESGVPFKFTLSRQGSGVYFVRINSGDRSLTERVVVSGQ